MFKEDTIAAITTGMSNAGVGIIRISGERACEIVDKIFRAANSKKKATTMKLTLPLSVEYMMEMR